MAVYLIRHAHAGSRSAWLGDDDDRPLSVKGVKQAEAIAKRLCDVPIERIVSSPSRRCVQTVEPLAGALGERVETDRVWLEGADADDAVEALLVMGHTDVALCSHGDLIPKVLRRLGAAGMRTKDANIAQKGSVWVLDLDDGRVVRGRYLPPAG